jgi:hypothetical protein
MITCGSSRELQGRLRHDGHRPRAQRLACQQAWKQPFDHVCTRWQEGRADACASWPRTHYGLWRRALLPGLDSGVAEAAAEALARLCHLSILQWTFGISILHREGASVPTKTEPHVAPASLRIRFPVSKSLRRVTWVYSVARYQAIVTQRHCLLFAEAHLCARSRTNGRNSPIAMAAVANPVLTRGVNRRWKMSTLCHAFEQRALCPRAPGPAMKGECRENGRSANFTRDECLCQRGCFADVRGVPDWVAYLLLRASARISEWLPMKWPKSITSPRSSPSTPSSRTGPRRSSAFV